MRILDIFKKAPSPTSMAIKADLKRLNRLKENAGDEAAKYVLTGNGGTVISTIATSIQNNPLRVGRSYDARGASIKRQKMLLRANPYPIEIVARYGEVLAETDPPIDQLPGSPSTPLAMRVIFAEANEDTVAMRGHWPRKVDPVTSGGLQPETAIRLIEIMGGSAQHFFDLIYVPGKGWAGSDLSLYREAVDVRPVTETYPNAAKAAVKTMSAAGRVSFLQDLAKWKLSGTTAYVEFVLDCLGDGAKTVREAAAAALIDVPADVIETGAIKRLSSGKAALREAIVSLLGRLGTTKALDALAARKETEKTARVRAAIDNALMSKDLPANSDDGTPQSSDDISGYTAFDGTRVEIPKFAPLLPPQSIKLTDQEKNELRHLIKAENEKIAAANKRVKEEKTGWKRPLINTQLVDKAFKLIETSHEQKKPDRSVFHIMNFGEFGPWLQKVLHRSTVENALQVCISLCSDNFAYTFLGGAGKAGNFARNLMHNGQIDLRHIEPIRISQKHMIDIGPWNKRIKRQFQPGDDLRLAIQSGWYATATQWMALPNDGVWPYIAENLDVLDEAFGLKPASYEAYEVLNAINLLTLLPKTPSRYFLPLLEIATGDRKAGRKEAQALLTDAPGVDDRLVDLLNDTRQAVRAGAATWLADRQTKAAIPAFKKRLKKEKSDLARAAMLTALDRLGEDLTSFIGPKALLEEAEKGLKRAKFDKLNWLGLDYLPKAAFLSGKSVPPEVLKYWISIAVKLKQPGGSALFDIYLNRLKPEDAEQFSTWLLDSWINYDTQTVSEAEANAKAKAGAPNLFKQWQKWMGEDWSLEKAFEWIKRDNLSTYLNSGAASKGLLALAVRATPAVAADRVRTYLKKHGSRTSQARALLEMLAHKADPISLQVVIAAATRLKQKSVQEFAGELVTRVAEAHNWTMDELGDRIVPAAGLEDDATLALPIGMDEKPYSARLADDLKLIILNPSGKKISSLPSGDDDITKASKKQLSASRRELKQVVTMQSTRLYEGLCAERIWSIPDWKRDFYNHPVMLRLISQLTWLICTEDGTSKTAFRPTLEGDFTDADDDDVTLLSTDYIRLAHSALVSEDEAQKWAEHFKDYEIQPLFAQFGRPLLSLSEQQLTEGATEITDRKGWLTEAFAFRSAASKLGYERGPAMDGGWFYTYTKDFKSAGLRAVIEFTGNGLPEENIPAALQTLTFERMSDRHDGYRYNSSGVTLSDVPPVLLSECWNDLHSFATKATFDADWEKKAQW